MIRFPREVGNGSGVEPPADKVGGDGGGDEPPQYMTKDGQIVEQPAGEAIEPGHFDTAIIVCLVLIPAVYLLDRWYRKRK